MLESRVEGQRDAPRAVIVDFGMAAVMEPAQNHALVDSCRYGLYIRLRIAQGRAVLSSFIVRNIIPP